MDTTKQPLVTFDLKCLIQIETERIDSRTCRALSHSALSGDGVQKILVSGAVAADNLGYC